MLPSGVIRKSSLLAVAGPHLRHDENRAGDFKAWYRQNVQSLQKNFRESTPLDLLLWDRMHKSIREHNVITCSSVTRERSVTFNCRNLGKFRGFYRRNGKSHKNCFGVGTPLALPLLRRANGGRGRANLPMEGLVKSKNAIRTCRPATRRPFQTTPKLRSGAKSPP